MKNDLIRLYHILESIETIEEYTQNISFSEFIGNKLIKDGCAKRMENLCEASINLSKELKEENPFVPWSELAGMRIILAHKYFSVDSGILWDSIQNELPAIRESILGMINNLEKSK